MVLEQNYFTSPVLTDHISKFILYKYLWHLQLKDIIYSYSNNSDCYTKLTNKHLYMFIGMSSSYPSMLTPPSSSEDSPQPVYYVASPNATSFQGPETYGQASQIYAPQIDYSLVAKDSIMDTSMLVDLPSKFLFILNSST